MQQTRDTLFCMLDRYLRAMAAHDPDAAGFSHGVKLTENGQILAPGRGLWATCTGQAQYCTRFADPLARRVGMIGVVEENGRPTVVALVLKIAECRITEVESIVARGHEMLFEPHNVIARRRELLEALKPEERRSREEMSAVTDLYFDGLRQATGRFLRMHPACNRYENGLLATNNPARDAMFRLSCRAQFDTGFSTIISEIRNRRFLVVDEEAGLVFAVVFFEHDGDDLQVTLADGTSHDIDSYYARPMAYLIGELFKIKNGEIREIEAVLLTVPYGMRSGWE